MNLQDWSKLIRRVFWVAGFLLLALAVVEKALNLTGYTLLATEYTAGRVVEFAGIMMVFVVALQLRAIREALRKR